MDVLVFEVGGVRYAVPAAQVREVVRAVTIVPLPHAPAIVEGVINVRGVLVPVLDVRSRFRLAPRPLSQTDHFVLAWAGSRLVAIRVDRAQDLLRVEPESIDASSLAPSETQYVAGVATLPDGLAIIHDLGAFLDEAEATLIGGAMATAAQAMRST